MFEWNVYNLSDLWGIYLIEKYMHLWRNLKFQQTFVLMGLGRVETHCLQIANLSVSLLRELSIFTIFHIEVNRGLA